MYTYMVVDELYKIASTVFHGVFRSSEDEARISIALEYAAGGDLTGVALESHF